MSGPPPRATTLEPIAARAWPAVEDSRIGGWRLYASSGYSGRINACWPLEMPGLSLDRGIDAVEAWYAARRLPSLFKIADGAAQPPGLLAALSARGYRPRTETLTLFAPARAAAPSAVHLNDNVEEAFRVVFEASGGQSADARERLAALGRMPRPRAFAHLVEGGAPAAIGACACQGSWAGIFAMRTSAAHRRQGFARRVLTALMAWAAKAGALRVYLQVEGENLPAVALYRQAGFEEAYRYRYWGPAPTGPS